MEPTQYHGRCRSDAIKFNVHLPTKHELVRRTDLAKLESCHSA